MSELPDGWLEVTFADVAEVNPRKSVELSPDDLVTFVPMSAVDEFSGTILSPVVRQLKEVSKGFTQFAEGDVIFAKITPSMENGKSAVALGLENGIGFGSTEFHVIRSQGAVLPSYLWRFVRQQGFRDNARQVMSGAVGQQRVPAEYLKTHQLPLPPLAEQERIVTRLSDLSAKLLRARTNLAAIPGLVAKYKEAILTRAFTGKLSAEWRDKRRLLSADDSALTEKIKQERIRIRAERGLRGSQRREGQPAASLTLPDLPRSWSWLTFDECSWDMTVGHVGPMKDRYVEAGIPFLRSMNVRPNRIDLADVTYIDEAFNAELRKSEIHPGELVVVRTGAPGTAAVVPESLRVANCSDLVIARLVPLLNAHFAAYFMNSQFAQAAVRGMQVGVAQQHFNVGAMREMPIPVPSIEEQVEIVRCIELAFAWLERISSEHLNVAKLLPQLEASILAKAFRGGLVRQDADEEPAGTLLDRVRLQRVERPKKPRAKRPVVKAQKEDRMIAKKDIEQVLVEADDWVPGQVAFQRCGIGDGAPTEDVEAVYARLRDLDASGRLEVEAERNAQGRKLYDRIRLKAI